MASMFALIVPGQLVQQVEQDPTSPERFLCSIVHSQPLNHITVFMTGAAPFPEGYGCTLHLFLPDKGWQLLGFLSNAKPSAIFRVKNAASSSSAFAASSAGLTTATLGVLCEPLPQVEAQIAALGAGGGAKPDVSEGAAGGGGGGALVLAREAAPVEAVKLAAGIGRNLFNSVGGFAQPFPEGSGMKGSWIALEVIERWYANFERKLKTVGVNFLLNQD